MLVAWLARSPFALELIAGHPGYEATVVTADGQLRSTPGMPMQRL